jgi:DNA-directed RNA polymerase subunit RPC12/RpoP
MKIAAGQPCPLCNRALVPGTLPEFSGDELPLSLAVRGMPILACEVPHRYFVNPEFPLWVMNHLVDEDEAKLPAGQAKGFLIKHYVCSECGKELAPKQDHRHSFHVPLKWKEGPEFEVILSMPVFKCTGCGQEQLHSLDEVRKLTPAALVHAFKGVGIKAPG